MPRKTTKAITLPHLSPFEQIRRTNDAGNEYWSSRDFAEVLDYSNYRNFEQVITKARTACFNSGQRIDDHFVDVTDMIEIGNGLKRQIQSVFLSRYACYLIVQNADPNKEIVALGQTYFAIQTRKQELIEQPTESLIKSAYFIYSVLRGVSSLQPYSHINLVFALLFYKRISDTFIIDMPQGCNWNDISSSENNKKLTMVVDNLRKILANYNDPGKDLYDVLNALNIYHICWDINAETQNAIFKVVDGLDLSLSKFDYFEFDTELSKILEDALKNDRHNGGEYFNPTWLEQLLVEMLEPKRHEIISFPFCKSASIITAFVKASQTQSRPSNTYNNLNPTIGLNIQGMEINQLMWAFAKLRLALLGGVALDISNANPFEVQPKLPSDVICFIPPFAYRQKGTPASCFIGKEKVEIPRSSGEVVFLINALQQASKTGRIGVVVPISFLFNHTLRKVRRALLEEDYLDAIIELPDRSFSPTASIKTVLLVLNKSKSPERKHSIALGISPDLNKKDNITFADFYETVTEYRSSSSSDKLIFVSKEDIQRQDYNLIPSYFHEGLNDELDALRINQNGKRLDEICQVIRGRARKPIEDSNGLPFISTKNLSGEVTDPYLDLSYVTLSKPEAQNHIITQKCILVSLIGREPKATIYDPQRAYKSEGDDVFDGILINQNIVCLVPNEIIVDFEYIYYQLNTPLVTKQFDNLHGGAGIPNISLSDFRSIIIPVLERKEQREITRQIKEALLREANANISVLKANLNIEEEKQEAEYQVVRHLAHNLSPRLSSVSSVLKHLYEFIEMQGLSQNHLQDQFYEGQVIELVGEAISKARQDVMQMDNLIKDTRKVITEEIKDEDFRPVNLLKLLSDIKAKYSNRSFTLKIECDDSISLELHKTTFTEMIDNFIRNAEFHGFTQHNLDDQVVLAAHIEKGILILDIKNNGLALPTELTVENFTSFGEKRTHSPGEGLGGAYIYKVIRAHGGSLQIIRSDAQYLTCFRVTFPLKEKTCLKASLLKH